MNIQQFGQTIKQKYPQYKDVSDEELGQKMITKYPQYKDMVQTDYQEHPFASAMRALGGGGLADISALAQEPGRQVRKMTNNYGMGGQVEANPFISQERVQEYGTPMGAVKNVVGDVAGSVSNLLPMEGLGLSKALTGVSRMAVAGAERLGLGAAQGGLQAFSQNQNIGSGAGIGAAMNVLIPGVSKLAEFVGKTVPRDITQSLIQKPAEKAGQLFREVAEKMVGPKNVEYALSKGILQKNAPLTIDYARQALDRSHEMINVLEDKLQSKFKDMYVPYGEIIPELKNIVRNSFPGEKAPDMVAIEDWLYNQVLKEYKGKTISEETKQKIIEGLKNFYSPITPYTVTGRKSSLNILSDLSSEIINDVITGKFPISLSTINQIKRGLGYNKDNPLSRQLYSHIKKYVEDRASGGTGEVKAINQELQKFVERGNGIRDRLENIVNYPSNLPTKYSSESINKSIKDAASGDVSSLNKLVAAASAAVTIPEALLGNHVSPGLGSLAAPITALLTYGKGKAWAKNPENQKMIGDFLSKTIGKAYDIGGPLQINKMLQKLGVNILSGTPSSAYLQ